MNKIESLTFEKICNLEQDKCYIEKKIKKYSEIIEHCEFNLKKVIKEIEEYKQGLEFIKKSYQ